MRSANEIRDQTALAVGTETARGNVIAAMWVRLAAAHQRVM
jgi:hypothetical protein